jgi:hypothetical protein
MRRGFGSARRNGALAGFGAAVGLAILITAGSSSAAASVTVGQTQATAETCGSGIDWVQPTVTSGNSFVVPATGTITSWSTNSNTMGGALTLKIFRQLGGLNYVVVGHDGPHSLSPSTLNSFTGISVPVKAGDVLGLNAGTGSPGCVFGVPGDAAYFRADVQSGEFAPEPDVRLNITAVLNPSNTFTLGATTRNKKKGTATIAANVPNRGTLTASGKGVRRTGAAVISKVVTAPGKVKLRIRARGRKRRTLLRTGRVKLKVRITYTPTGGDPRIRSRKVTLKKRL